MLDLTVGLGFIAKLSNIPSEYKARVDRIYALANESKLTSEEILEHTNYFRGEVFQCGIRGETDRAHFANAFMMMLHALEDYKHLKEEDWKRRDKAARKAEKRIEKQKQSTDQ